MNVAKNGQFCIYLRQAAICPWQTANSESQSESLGGALPNILHSITLHLHAVEYCWPWWSLLTIGLLYVVLQEQYEFALAAVAQEVHSLLVPSVQ